MNAGLGFALACGVFALLYGGWSIKWILAQPAGNERMREIAAAIQEGASAYLKKQYTAIAIVGVVLARAHLDASWERRRRSRFAIGALFSGADRLHRHVRLGPRQCAHRRSSAKRHLNKALNVAFSGGAITGMLVVGLGLLGVAGYYAAACSNCCRRRARLSDVIKPLVGLGFGGSLISIFARLGGGIFTKGADVGADLVGKVEAGIPEDDPRNPAVIADNVGDNVGDCAGMAADLFETYAVTMIATMLLGALTFKTTSAQRGHLSADAGRLLDHRLDHRHASSSKLGPGRKIMTALYKGLIVAGVLALHRLLSAHRLHDVSSNASFDIGGVATFSAISTLRLPPWSAWSLTGAMVCITEYYTATEFAPVRHIAAGLDHRPRHQHHRRPGRVHEVPPRCRCCVMRLASVSPITGPASTASPLPRFRCCR